MCKVVLNQRLDGYSKVTFKGLKRARLVKFTPFVSSLFAEVEDWRMSMMIR